MNPILLFVGAVGGVIALTVLAIGVAVAYVIHRLTRED